MKGSEVEDYGNRTSNPKILYLQPPCVCISGTIGVRVMGYSENGIVNTEVLVNCIN